VNPVNPVKLFFGIGFYFYFLFWTGFTGLYRITEIKLALEMNY
jgi:hypothetical protein